MIVMVAEESDASSS